MFMCRCSLLKDQGNKGRSLGVATLDARVARSWRDPLPSRKPLLTHVSLVANLYQHRKDEVKDEKTIDLYMPFVHSFIRPTSTPVFSSHSPVSRTWNPLEARREPSVPILTGVIEQDYQAISDDRLVVGVLPIRRRCESIRNC
jgi:hypothetical protein